MVYSSWLSESHGIYIMYKNFCPQRIDVLSNLKMLPQHSCPVFLFFSCLIEKNNEL